MHQYLILLCLLFTTGSALAQVPKLGLLPPQVYLYKEILAGPFSSVNDLELAVKRTKRAEPELSAFTDPMEAQIVRKAPGWFKAAGVKGLATLKFEELSAEEQEKYLNFHTKYAYLQGHMDMGGVLVIGGKARNKQLTVELKDDTNNLADKVDRDYLIFMDVYGYYSVTKRKSKEEVDLKKLKGGVLIAVSIFDAATGIAEVTKVKAIMGDQPKRINDAQILKEMESLVGKAYKKFSKRF